MSKIPEYPCPWKRFHLWWEGIRNGTEPAEPNRTEITILKRNDNNNNTCYYYHLIAVPKLCYHYYRSISEPAGTGRRNEPKRTGPSRGASEECRPNLVEPGKWFLRTEPMNFRKVRNRNESNRTGSFLHWPRHPGRERSRGGSQELQAILLLFVFLSSVAIIIFIIVSSLLLLLRLLLEGAGRKARTTY